MTPAQIDLVKSSFTAVEPIAEQAGQMFYDRLFALDPELRPLFKGDIKTQSKKLMQMIAVAVNNLDRPDALIPAVEALGARHGGYGVVDDHYATVAEALLWTLKQGLGPDFTPDVAGAWTEAYAMLADVMKAAARQASSRRL